ncbi:arylamine N-acetyltransferase [Anderseniella sp. Alg231-50]|uniref:arylamine N-acetyltransferase n=1 Tax=Anderseniella sp. Alg231-50 TaxID=1922226 RepID=UPI000D562C52
MNLDHYLNRIRFTGDPRPDRSTLTALMQAQLQTVPFENLDQQLGIPVPTDVESAYTKVVDNHRGGWCFELNALFRWALTEVGFEVQTLAGHVGDNGESRTAPADHMFLRVDCEEPLLVDTGFGGSMIEPISLFQATSHQPPYTLSVTDEDNGWFRFSEQLPGGEPTSFDYKLISVDDIHFDEISKSLQTDETSSFRRMLKAQRRYSDRHIILRGCIKRTIGPQGMNEQVLTSSKALLDCLQDDFNLDVPEIASIWSKINNRHAELFG